MLTKDVIIANAVLAGLSPEQIQAIETLSQNDENTVIASKIADIASKVEAKALEISGIPKQQGEKYYDYNARVMAEMKAASGSTSAEITAKETEIARLKAELAKGGDAASKSTIADLQARLADEEKRVGELRTALQQKDVEYSTALKDRDERFTESQFVDQWRSATEGLERKPGLEDSVFEELAKGRLNAAMSRYGRKLEETADGKVLRLVDANGLTVNNPANLGNPLTVADLARQELGDLFQAPKKQPGGGSKPPAPGAPPPSGGGGSGAIQGATQVEVTANINAHLRSQGIATNHPTYQDKFDSLFKESVTDDMPLQ